MALSQESAYVGVCKVYQTVVPSIVKWYGEAERDAEQTAAYVADMQDIERARKELEEIPGLVLNGIAWK